MLALIDERITAHNGPLEDHTPLISSGLLDSLAVLVLVGWIDDELGARLDLQTMDIPREWNTVTDILAFMDAR